MHVNVPLYSVYSAVRPKTNMQHNLLNTAVLWQRQAIASLAAKLLP
jgi:hypothetical protein